MPQNTPLSRRAFTAASSAAFLTAFTPFEAASAGRRKPIGYLRTNWGADPYALGAYSFIKQGARRRMHRDLAKPMGRVFFAGEATHPRYNSTVHAAYESGIFAAQAIARARISGRVAIIGAGISGLSAARALAETGIDSEIFEARDRIGGRLHTVTSLGVATDLGASWIHGDRGNPIAKLASSAGIETLETGEDYINRGAGGTEIADKDLPEWMENVVGVQHSAGADLTDLNLAAYALIGDYTGRDLLLPDGYAQILDIVSKGTKVTLSTEITQISHFNESVVVNGKTGTLGTYSAVIVTVPLGVLKAQKITFSPAIPKTKQAAIDALGMGLLDKVYLRYDDVFWDADKTWILTPETGLPEGHFNQWFNMSKIVDAPVIMALNGGPPAWDISKLSDKDVVKHASSVIEGAYS